MVKRRPPCVVMLTNQHMSASHQQVEFVQPMNIVRIIKHNYYYSNTWVSIDSANTHSLISSRLSS